jgi:3-oxoacyl-[acyl-carrier-protein] synthase-3
VTRAVVTGLGFAVPEQRLTNAEIQARVDTSDEWILERTGISERRIAGPDDTTSSLATAAGAAAIKDAGLTPDDVDLLIVATCTPDQAMPATSAFVQDALGLRCGAFDAGAVCSGFVYALVMAAGMVESGRIGTALVVGAETLSRIVDPDDRSTLILFGDGAGACIVSGGDDRDDRGLLTFDLGCDGAAAGILEIPPGQPYIQMEGREVFRRAVRVVVQSAQATLEAAGVTAADVDVFVPHQANARIVSAAGDRLGIPADRTIVNLDRYGNTSAASVPIALTEARDAGRLHDGDLVLLSGFGAGMTWASALIRWGTPA